MAKKYFLIGKPIENNGKELSLLITDGQDAKDVVKKRLNGKRIETIELPESDYNVMQKYVKNFFAIV